MKGHELTKESTERAMAMSPLPYFSCEATSWGAIGLVCRAIRASGSCAPSDFNSAASVVKHDMDVLTIEAVDGKGREPVNVCFHIHM